MLRYNRQHWLVFFWFFCMRVVMKTEKIFLSPAKINLCLYVLGRYASGYHRLAMAMQRIDLCDEVMIAVDDSTRGVVTVCDAPGLRAEEKNIASSAAELLLAEAGLDIGVEIRIDKRILVAAGLGGGSSNAATVLMGLNELLRLGYNKAELCRLGAQLGSDVPFFVYQRPAWATGTGTDLEKMTIGQDFSCLIVNPGIAVSTADVYRSLRLTKGVELANLPRFSAKTRAELCASLHNDLEPVVIARFPVIAEIKQQLLEFGALGSLMSGSGATVFGLFSDYESAFQVGCKIAETKGWFAYAARPLD